MHKIVPKIYGKSPKIQIPPKCFLAASLPFTKALSIVSEICM